MSLMHKEPYITPEMIATWNSGTLKKGNNTINGVFSGITNGNGAYSVIFIPCKYEDGITGGSIAANGDDSIRVCLPTETVNVTGLDITNYVVSPKETGIQLNIKFSAAKTAYRPISVYIAGAILTLT